MVLLLVLQVARSRRRAQPTLSTTCDSRRHVMDPASKVDAVRNLRAHGRPSPPSRTHAIRGRDTVDARGLVVAPGFIDLHAHGQTPRHTGSTRWTA